MYNAPFAGKPSDERVETRFIADDRIQFGPLKGRIFVDYEQRRLDAATFELGHLLAGSPDIVFNHRQLVAEIYHYTDPTVQMLDDLTGMLHDRVSGLRAQLGPELGDISFGAIRTEQSIGYLAVSRLESL